MKCNSVKMNNFKLFFKFFNKIIASIDFSILLKLDFLFK